MDLDELQRQCSGALDAFVTQEHKLFKQGAGERTLVAALRGYLDGRFGDLDVDAEYNRHGNEPKYLPRYRELLMEHGLEVPEHDAPRSIDIVVHRRGDDSANLLAIEVKRSQNSEDRRYDHLKLQALREALGYRLTLFLEFGPHGERLQEEWCLGEEGGRDFA